MMPSVIQKQSYGSVTLFSRDERAIQSAIQQLAADLSERPEVMAVLLFGSQAQGATSVDSDVDLLIVLAAHDQPFLQRLPYYRPETFPVDVDVFPYTIAEIAAGQPLAQTALSTGRLLWQRPGFTLMHDRQPANMKQTLMATKAIQKAHQPDAQASGVLAAKPQFPRQGEWTYEDWLNFPDDGWKYEIIDGVLHMSPPPLIDHQDMLLELAARMRTHARRSGLGKVLCAPCGVRLPGQSAPLEPDILFVRRERLAIIERRYVAGAPDLVVEILSPSNANYDLKTKYALYERSGVVEYWTVIPWDKQIRVYRLVDGAYQLAGEYDSGQVARSDILTGFTIAGDELFELEMENTDVQKP